MDMQNEEYEKYKEEYKQYWEDYQSQDVCSECGRRAPIVDKGLNHCGECDEDNFLAESNTSGWF